MIRTITICAGCDATISVVFRHGKTADHTQYLMCEECRKTLDNGLTLPSLQVCPHGLPIETQCIGCMATVGGNSGA